MAKRDFSKLTVEELDQAIDKTRDLLDRAHDLLANSTLGRDALIAAAEATFRMEAAVETELAALEAALKEKRK